MVKKKTDILVLDILLESRHRKLIHWFTRNRKVNINDSGIIFGQIPLHVDIHLSGDTPKFKVMYWARIFISRLTILE